MERINFSERQDKILMMTEQAGFVIIESLAEEFDVSAQTIRRDIIYLSNAGHIQRFHGGAGVIGEIKTPRLDHNQKAQISVKAKMQVAEAAAALGTISGFWRRLAISGDTPAYRGMAYVVVERLALNKWGICIPQRRMSRPQDVASVAPVARQTGNNPGSP